MEDKDIKKEIEKDIKEEKVVEKTKSVLPEKEENEDEKPTESKTIKKEKDDKKNDKKPIIKKRSFAGRRPRRRNSRRNERPEFTQKIINIRRVTRVMAGGRRFSFSVVMVLGDKKGRVGVGVGKATDTALAIEKAIRKAKINMITVKRTKNNSIPHEVGAKFCSSVVMIVPVKGKGLVAGSSVRNVLDLAGITDISAKILSRSKNKLNNAQATIVALKQL